MVRGERGQVGWIVLVVVVLVFIGAGAVCAFIIPGDGDNEHSYARTELAARSHDCDDNCDDEGEDEGGGGTTNFFSPKVDKLVICLPSSSCPQA